MKNLFKNKYWLFIIVCISLVLICSKSSDNTTLDEVKLKNEIEVNKKQFAMYTRDSEDSEYTEYTGEDLFPKGYKLNKEQSSCMDINGEDVTTEEVISQTDDGKIMVTSTKTIYCTFYFDKGPTASDTLTTNPGSYLKQSNKGDLKWRYVGNQSQSSSINNYVCFGASSCNGETDNHLYRIIGITEQGNLKIQKNSSITPSQWHTSYQSDIKWPSSTMYTNTLKSTFYGSTTYVSNEMKSRIENHTWNTGDVTDYSNATSGSYGTKIYEQEKATNSHTGEVGLAYMSDYYFAYNEQGTQNCVSTSPYCKSWMVPSNYTTFWSGKSYEWTMTRYGLSGGYYGAWNVYYGGIVSWTRLTSAYAVRPVFYLKSEVTISGGEGNSSSPYIIN